MWVKRGRKRQRHQGNGFGLNEPLSLPMRVSLDERRICRQSLTADKATALVGFGDTAGARRSSRNRPVGSRYTDHAGHDVEFAPDDTLQQSSNTSIAKNLRLGLAGRGRRRHLTVRENPVASVKLAQFRN
jgi:hypothetical protein